MSYVTLAQLKAALDITDTDSDVEIQRALDAADNWIDEYCRRTFTLDGSDVTRYLYPNEDGSVTVPDVMTVTSIKTDRTGDRTFANALTASDYELLPLDGPPYQAVRIWPTSSDSFERARQVQVVGRYGYVAPVAVGTLGAAITTTDGTSVTMTAGHSVVAGQTILIDDERMYVSVVATNTLTVSRGAWGSTAATHALAATVRAYRAPDAVMQAAVILASRYFKRREAPFGILQTVDLGQYTRISAADPDVLALLRAYRLPLDWVVV